MTIAGQRDIIKGKEVISLAKMFEFPPTMGEIFRDLDESRKIKGKATVDQSKFSRYVDALKSINEYGTARGKPVKAIIDDPREPFYTHVVMLDFETSEFEGNEIAQLVKIISPFDFADFACDSEGNLSILLHIEDMYQEEK